MISEAEGRHERLLWSGVMRDDQKPPETPEAATIERYKAAGLFRVRDEDVDKPWADQRLVKTPLGEIVEEQMRQEHPEWFVEPH